MRIAQAMQQCARSAETEMNAEAAAFGEPCEDGLVARIGRLDGELSAYGLRSSS